jgi:POLQ-like helicase
MSFIGELLMKPDFRSQRLLSITQSKAKMYEYSVPLEEHIDLTADPTRDPTRLFPLAIGMLGDLAARINDGNATEADIQELRASLPFSARFFDAFVETRLNQETDSYIQLLGSAAYYLCNLPGSSHILVDRIRNQDINFGTHGLENLLRWLLLIKDFPTKFPDISDNFYEGLIEAIRDLLVQFNETGMSMSEVLDLARQLRTLAYELGTPKELILADLIGAIIRKRFDNSTWKCLPKYTDLSVTAWTEIIKKRTFIKEFWSAQHLIGEKGIFRGRSAVIQMPTSAGKTKATEVIIRSAFLSKRTSLAVIIAPFRALCHEIRQSLLYAFQGEAIYVDELSDVFQTDYSVERILRGQNVLVSTPEKFNYVLRHEPGLAENIGLIIYDEGHQFDNGTRGITYELLLTSLKAKILETTQTILISAVISNADQIGKWLIGDGVEIVDGSKLTPSAKSIGFATIDNPGRNLYFVQGSDIDEMEYFVPRIFEQYDLKKKVVFPHFDNGKEIALFLGIRLAGQGSIAIFSGTKDTVHTMCETVTKVFRNGLTVSPPSDRLRSTVELKKIKYLHDVNLGEKSIYSQAAQLGIFSHHNNIPHGIRLAVEYGMKESDINFVICTSTLAQGVNLPIRYLIVTSVYQGRDKISVRDFQNLIGRSGRSGMHTEGSILFADPVIYDEKENWNRVKELLDPSKSEKCDSQLLALFRPLYNDYGDTTLSIELDDFVQIYFSGRDAINSWTLELAEQYSANHFSEYRLRRQIEQKVTTLSATESYLMAYWDPELDVASENDVIELARGTLAYFIADEEEKSKLENLFITLARNVVTRMPDPIKRRIFGKTMYGISDSLAISDWVDANLDAINYGKTDVELFEVLWPLIERNIHNQSFRKCSIPSSMKDLAFAWLEGKPFHVLLTQLSESGARLGFGDRPRYYREDHVVDICENGFAYEGILVLGALIELLPSLPIENVELLISTLQYLQKRLKYGLQNHHAIVLYELGFADRVIAIELDPIFLEISPEKSAVVLMLKARREETFVVLDKYPAYFRKVYENIAT